LCREAPGGKDGGQVACSQEFRRLSEGGDEGAIAFIELSPAERAGETPGPMWRIGRPFNERGFLLSGRGFLFNQKGLPLSQKGLSLNGKR
jgi:hypothetical protein